MEHEHILIRLSRRYPQLLLPIADETPASETYREAVLCGKELTGTPDFTLSAADRFEVAETPAGSVEVLSLAEREDFEHCFRALACRCRATEIPGSIGASIISGLINWEKIRNHRDAYLAAGGEDWDAEFNRFTAEAKNYRDTLVLLSRGYYSALGPEDAGFPAEQWLQLSYEIRKYHELAHFVSRKLYPQNKDAVRDEILADMNGIIGALGYFDAELEARMLGIRDGRYVGGRLENYVAAAELDAAVKRTCSLLADLKQNCTGAQKPFAYLMELEETRKYL